MIRYRWRVRTYSGPFAHSGRLLRWMAPRQTESWGTADSMDKGLAKAKNWIEAVAAVSPSVYVVMSCRGYLTH